MGRGHQWFKLRNMEKPKEILSNEDLSESQNSPAASPPSPAIPTVVPGTTATAGGETSVAHQDEEEAEYLGPKALYILISSLMLVVIVLTLDQSILATAVPYVTNEFHTIADIGWYASAYLLSTAALQPLTGKVYTYFPLKISFLAFLVGFEVGSLICALANSSAMLVVGRAVAGIGGSGIINGSLTIIAVAAHPSKRPAILATVMAMAGAGQLLGPLIGGALTQHVSWRWCFWINLPIGGVTVVVMALIQFPAYKARKATWTIRDFIRDFDLIGFSIFAPASIMILLALQWGGSKYPWSSALVIGLICGSVGAFCVFAAWEYRQGEHAMIPYSLVRQRVVYSSLVTTVCQFGGIMLQAYYLPLWFQTVKGNSPTMSAVHTLPSFLTQMLFAITSGAITPRIGYLLPFGLFGNTFASIGAGLMTTLRPNTEVGKWIGYQIVGGVGRGVSTQQPLMAVQSVVKADMIPIATATLMWAQMFGGAIFLGIGQTAFINLLRSALRSYAPGLNPEDVIAAGATDFIKQLEVEGDIVTGQQVVRAYNKAIANIFYIGMGLAIFGFFTSFGLGKTKVEQKQKKPIGKKIDEEKGATVVPRASEDSEGKKSTINPSTHSAGGEQSDALPAVQSK